MLGVVAVVAVVVCFVCCVVNVVCKNGHYRQLLDYLQFVAVCLYL